MIITAIQMPSTTDVAKNIETADKLMQRAAVEHRCDWILLPEHFHWAGGTRNDKLLSAEVLGKGPAYDFCRKFARDHRLFVHAGSIFERIPGDDRIYNTSVAFDRGGNEVARYRKIHLFDITGPDGVEHRESETVQPGEDVVVYPADGMMVGCSVCYDLRFPELFQALVRRGAQVIALPAAFTQLTGQAHWEPLIRARAIETQAYVAAAGSCSVDDRSAARNRTYGHSMVVDPWGRVVQVLAEGEGFVSCRIDRELIRKVRADMPLAAHRRRDLYAKWSRED